MNKTLLIAAGILLFVACNNKTNTSNEDVTTTEAGALEVDTASAVLDTASVPVMSFESASYNFGQVKSGEKVSYKFKFRNTGKSPLIISNAQATCGCTVPDYPKTPVAPGGEGVISVVYDSAGQTGMQTKMVTLTSNAIPSVMQLYLTGQVM